MAYEIRRQRRRYSKAFKRRVVAETLEAGASVSAVARRHGPNANMVLMWRWDPRFGPGRELASFHPVEVTGTQVPAPLSEVRAEAGGPDRRPQDHSDQRSPVPALRFGRSLTGLRHARPGRLRRTVTL